MNSYFDQHEYEIRCEWGPEGIKLLTPTSDVVIIIDIFSFTTAVDIALSRGARVYPYRWKDETAIEFAQSMGAIPAISSRRGPTGFSLSPASLARLPLNTPIVLPSPNGSTLSLSTGDTPTLAGCLRNARAVAQAASKIGIRISVIPGGERWPDGSLRPALEDLIGAGAIIHNLNGKKSPEAELAEAAFLHFRESLETVLANCSSGKEVADRGTSEDVRLASALNASSIAPQLMNGAYQPALAA